MKVKPKRLNSCKGLMVIAAPTSKIGGCEPLKNPVDSTSCELVRVAIALGMASVRQKLLCDPHSGAIAFSTARPKRWYEDNARLFGLKIAFSWYLMTGYK